MPKWKKLFKALGIYNKDYHEKYREHIHGERYKTYIDLVMGDVKERFRSLNKMEVRELIFSKPTFAIENGRK